jgi:DNA polymerase III subunit gamma/tau
MSYQVIARKWRPQRFEEVTGQEPISRTLQNSIRMGRLHHAYLFSGPRGCGKTTTARILAKALNCFKGTTPEPCGECSSCLEIAAGNSIDVHEMDAASNTGVDNVRDVIINTIAINPARDRYKVFIIDEVHMLSMSAFNALLKTLEEPPPHAVFILATTELHKVPQTILSRCQQFEFRTIPADSIVGRLRLIADAEKIDVSNSALTQIALAGQGSMRDAQSAFDQVISFSGQTIKDEDVRAALGIINQQTLIDFTMAIAEADGKKLLQLVAELSSTGYDLRQFCRDLMVHFRNLLVLKTAGYDRESLPIVESELSRYQAQAGRFSSEDLVRFFNLLTTLEQEIKLTTQPRFQLEIGLIKLSQMSRLQSIDEILQRLVALEERLSGGSPSHVIPKRSAEQMSAPTPIRSSAIISSADKVASKKELPARASSTAPPPEPPPEDAEPGTGSQIAKTPLKLSTSGDPVERLKEALGSRSMLIAALGSAQIEIGEQSVVIQFDSKTTELYKKARGDRQAIAEAARAVFGRDMNVVVSLAGGQAASEEEAESSSEQKLRKQAETDPAVRLFLNTFKGEITKVEKNEE